MNEEKVVIKFKIEKFNEPKKELKQLKQQKKIIVEKLKKLEDVKKFYKKHHIPIIRIDTKTPTIKSRIKELSQYVEWHPTTIQKKRYDSNKKIS